MSHVPNVFSPEGTALIDRTVGELVAERPGRSRVFQGLGMDFCCQGNKTLAQACEKKGLKPEFVAQLLDEEGKGKADEGDNPASLPPAELCSYIVSTHHQFLRDELPRLFAMSQRVAHVHGGHTPSLVEVFEVFAGLAKELEDHIGKEEKVLFPAVENLASAEKAGQVSLNAPVEAMLREHDDAGEALAKLRELTNGFTPPPDACNTYRALFAGLADLEEDLHKHIHLENSVLFPQALALAS
ncbi:iron-sulfur cluster repair di-iron protein [Pelagicoccus sp. SDUM812002]|uniref:iron-sulfur cluster repair di-iron protein n=1 Tax=Pelagicoccus sp. SDUM812002 TaxID=3041266 RepID=UPI00280FA1E3|nr:iron-sulfur cluster repair di-iron protein [Pelagicoccus sp. SDUM812002]MDQ8184619.1 iron-sulfur cluster repair di-iron protein [Pelagicoccus sp. SDUM812002]